MKRQAKKYIYLGLGGIVPFLYFISPNWISIYGIQPNWGIIWLLPWAIEEGPILGMLGGLCCSLLLDSVLAQSVTQIPSFVLLGYWWGRIGFKGPLIENSFSLGLLVFIGSFFNGLIIWLQQTLLLQNERIYLFNISIFQILITETIVTAILAPMICSCSLLSFFRKKN